MALTQDTRLIQIDTKLGKDALILTAFSGVEALSEPFRFQIEFIAEARDLAGLNLDKVLEQPVDITVRGETDRIFNGMVSRMSAGELIEGGGMRSYRAEVVPEFWLLTQREDCRIFQDMSAKDIISKMLDDVGLSDYRIAASGGTHVRPYCVQFNETDFQFISRLLEEEGICYFFEHRKGKHTMVLADAPSHHDKCMSRTVEYRRGTQPAEEFISYWERRFRIHAQTWTTQDYNYETPTTNLTADALADGEKTQRKLEVYRYPGAYAEKPRGTKLMGFAAEAASAENDIGLGASSCVAFTAGGVFDFKHGDIEEEDGEFLITYVEHDAVDTSHLVGEAREKARHTGYANRFQSIPSSKTFRPQALTPKPFMRGPQSALVVGASGEEIDVDEMLRIKVLFYWDREGKKDDKATCRIRVQQPWSGNGWGHQYIPRVGMEVLVDFIDGDPDRPIITGAAYHAENKVPYPLPAEKTRSGIKTRSTKSGGADNYNELSFEDKKGSEEFRIQAEKDYKRLVKNDENTEVQHDQTLTVTNDRTITVKEGNEVKKVDTGDQTITIKAGKQTITVEKDQTVEVKAGSQKITIQKDQTVKLTQGNQSTTISMGNHTLKVAAGKSKTEAAMAIEFKCGGSSIKMSPAEVKIKAPMIKIQADAMLEGKSPMTTVKGDGMLTLKGGITMIN